MWKNKGFSTGWMLADTAIAFVFLRLRNNDFTHSVDPIKQRGRCRTQPLLKSLRALIVDDLDLF